MIFGSAIYQWHNLTLCYGCDVWNFLDWYYGKASHNPYFFSVNTAFILLSYVKNFNFNVCFNRKVNHFILKYGGLFSLNYF